MDNVFMDEAIRETHELAEKFGFRQDAIAKQLMISANYWYLLAGGKRKPGKLLRREIGKLRDRLKSSGLLETT
jgi:hypothetical protein